MNFETIISAALPIIASISSVVVVAVSFVGKLKTIVGSKDKELKELRKINEQTMSENISLKEVIRNNNEIMTKEIADIRAQQIELFKKITEDKELKKVMQDSNNLNEQLRQQFAAILRKKE